MLPDIYYKQAVELFLTEYPNGKRHPAGYATSSKAIAQAKKSRLSLNNLSLR